MATNVLTQEELDRLNSMTNYDERYYIPVPMDILRRLYPKDRALKKFLQGYLKENPIENFKMDVTIPGEE